MVIKKDTNKIALKLLEESNDDFISRDYQTDLIDNAFNNSVSICSDNEVLKSFMVISLVRKYIKYDRKNIMILVKDDNRLKYFSEVIQRHCEPNINLVQCMNDFNMKKINYICLVNYLSLFDHDENLWKSAFENTILLVIDDCFDILEIDNKLRYLVSLINNISNIHVLGLNNAIINQISLEGKIEMQLHEIESLLHCHVDIGSQNLLQLNFQNSVTEQHLFYDEANKDISISRCVRDKLNQAIEFLMDIEEFYIGENNASEEIFSYCLNSCLKCREILDNLGIWCCWTVARAFIRHLLRLSFTRKNTLNELCLINGEISSFDPSMEDEIGRIMRNITSLMNEISRLCSTTFDGMADYSEFQTVMSSKVKHLVEELKLYKPSLNFKIEAIKLPSSSKDSDCGTISSASSLESLNKELSEDNHYSDFDTSENESVPTDDENPSVDRGGPTFRTRTFSKRKNHCKRHRGIPDPVNKSSANRFLFRAVVPEVTTSDSSNENFNKLCCLIYVNCSFTAYALSRLLDELCIWDPDLFFLHPGHVFTVCNSQGVNKKNDDTGSVSLGQEETINKFRKGQTNCLVTTQILDNFKFDLQKCNLVIRFDPVMNLQQYFSCKSRVGIITNAASMLRKANSSVADAISHLSDRSKAKLIHMISKEDKCSILSHLDDYRKVETGIINRINKVSSHKSDDLMNQNPVVDLDINSLELPIQSSGIDSQEPSVAKYIFNKMKEFSTTQTKKTKQKVTLSQAIALVNLYCARLPTDSFTKLTPELRIECDNKSQKTLYRCHLRLPINSPHRLVTKGKWMPTISTAKMSSALQTLKQLYELRELDNHFYPWNKEDNREVVSIDESNKIDENIGGMLMGSSKCRYCYERQFAKCISTTPILPNTPCYMYSITLELSRKIPDEQNLKGRKIMISADEAKDFGIICGQIGLDKTLKFPIFTRSGEEEVQIKQLLPLNSCVETWVFNEKEFQKISEFHHILITSVFRLKLDKGMVFDLEDAVIKLLLVPLNKNVPGHVDWEFIDLVIRSYNSVENVCRLETRRKPNGMFEFNELDYQNAVVMPSYRNFDHRQYYYVADICWNMRPTTDFPGEHFSTFAEYYTKKYGAKITNYQQPLLDADFSVMRLNLTIPRHVNFKGVPLPVPSAAKKKFFRESNSQKQFLIPELCYIHPFPATFWHKAASMPTIMHRINQLLLAEELRSQIAIDVGLGLLNFPIETEKLIMDYNLSGGLRNEEEINRNSNIIIGSYLNETKIIEENDNQNNYLSLNNAQRSDNDYGEFRASEFLGENEQEYLESVSDVESDDSFEDDKILYLPDEDNVRYDVITRQRHNNKEIPGITDAQLNVPGPHVILEAITMLCASDFINLERMETVGDSFLKYASTVYNFLRYPYAHEGRLSYLRSKQVSNSNLYLRAKEKNLAGFLNSQKFNPQDNWMLPGYKYTENIDVSQIINENYSNFCPRIQHFLTDKNLADVVESLTGCYLATRGEVSALRLLQWFNINCIPIDEHAIPSDTCKASDLWIKPESPITVKLETDKDITCYNNLIKDVIGLEVIIGYQFKEKAYLLQAMTHSSYYLNVFTDCYQRLELLGDAVLDYTITRFLYEDCRRHSPGDLTDLRSALVNNNIFASLVVRYNVHQYFKCISPVLWKLIDKFVYYQKIVMKDDLDYVIHQETFQNNIDESLHNIDEEVEIPKCLGDIFESLAGAIFLDSGMDLNTVWKVFHPLFHERIERYTSLIPKSPVRQLLEAMPEIVNFEYPKRTADGKTRVCVRIIGKGRFYGIGRNYRIAKSVAAKKALRKLQIDNFN